jgi:hypothetical protein
VLDHHLDHLVDPPLPPLVQQLVPLQDLLPGPLLPLSRMPPTSLHHLPPFVRVQWRSFPTMLRTRRVLISYLCPRLTRILFRTTASAKTARP